MIWRTLFQTIIGRDDCNAYIQSRSSSVNSDGESIDFSMPMFLGIPNPMEFPVTASEWEVSRVVSNLQINVYVGILY